MPLPLLVGRCGEQDIFSFGVLLAHVMTRRVPGLHGFLERTPRKKFAVDIDELRYCACVCVPMCVTGYLRNARSSCTCLLRLLIVDCGHQVCDA